MDNSDTCAIQYTQHQEPSYPILLHSVNPYYMVNLYDKKDLILIEKIMEWDQLHGKSQAYDLGKNSLICFKVV